jgi:hypothetical protein
LRKVSCRRVVVRIQEYVLVRSKGIIGRGDGKADVQIVLVVGDVDVGVGNGQGSIRWLRVGDGDSRPVLKIAINGDVFVRARAAGQGEQTNGNGRQGTEVSSCFHGVVI